MEQAVCVRFAQNTNGARKDKGYQRRDPEVHVGSADCATCIGPFGIPFLVMTSPDALLFHWLSFKWWISQVTRPQSSIDDSSNKHLPALQNEVFFLSFICRLIKIMINQKWQIIYCNQKWK